jgi:hypothetical protein
VPQLHLGTGAVGGWLATGVPAMLTPNSWRWAEVSSFLMTHSRSGTLSCDSSSRKLGRPLPAGGAFPVTPICFTLGFLMRMARF